MYLTTIGLHAMNLILAFVIAFYLLQDKERCLAVENNKSIPYLSVKYIVSNGIMQRYRYIFSGYIEGSY